VYEQYQEHLNKLSGNCPKLKWRKTMNQLLQTPTATAPSISSAAMIVDFNASVWTARKKDRKASDDVTNMNAADKGVANAMV
jgi:hypothetical protein